MCQFDFKYNFWSKCETSKLLTISKNVYADVKNHLNEFKQNPVPVSHCFLKK